MLHMAEYTWCCSVVYFIHSFVSIFKFSVQFFDVIYVFVCAYVTPFHCVRVSLQDTQRGPSSLFSIDKISAGTLYHVWTLYLKENVRQLWKTKENSQGGLKKGLNYKERLNGTQWFRPNEKSLKWGWWQSHKSWWKGRRIFCFSYLCEAGLEVMNLNCEKKSIQIRCELNLCRHKDTEC